MGGGAFNLAKLYNFRYVHGKVTINGKGYHEKLYQERFSSFTGA